MTRHITEVKRAGRIEYRGGITGNGDLWVGYVITEIWPSNNFWRGAVRYCRVVVPHKRTRHTQGVLPGVKL